MQFAKSLTSLIFVLGLSACTTKPPQVTADIDLVQPVSNQHEYVSYNNVNVSSSSTGNLVNFASGQYRFKGQYVSARGYTCHRLVYAGDQQLQDSTEKRVCRDSSGWFIVPPLMNDLNDI